MPLDTLHVVGVYNSITSPNVYQLKEGAINSFELPTTHDTCYNCLEYPITNHKSAPEVKHFRELVWTCGLYIIIRELDVYRSAQVNDVISDVY